MTVKIDPEKAMMSIIRVQLRNERRLLSKYPGRVAAFIPTFKTYTKEDIALLIAEARVNGGLLPIAVRKAFLAPLFMPESSPEIPPEDVTVLEPGSVPPAGLKFSIQTKPENIGFRQLGESKRTRNWRKRLRKLNRAG